MPLSSSAKARTLGTLARLVVMGSCFIAGQVVSLVLCRAQGVCQSVNRVSHAVTTLFHSDTQMEQQGQPIVFPRRSGTRRIRPFTVAMLKILGCFGNLMVNGFERDIATLVAALHHRAPSGIIPPVLLLPECRIGVGIVVGRAGLWSPGRRGWPTRMIGASIIEVGSPGLLWPWATCEGNIGLTDTATEINVLLR